MGKSLYRHAGRSGLQACEPMLHRAKEAPQGAMLIRERMATPATGKAESSDRHGKTRQWIVRTEAKKSSSACVQIIFR